MRAFLNEPLNILSLHRMGDPQLRREAVRELEYMMPTYAPGHNHIVHDADLPLPQYIKDIEFHAIILGPTFLCSRFIPGRFKRTLKQYSFIKESNAFKIAMPQDDYNCSAILDRWMVNWDIDLLFSICFENRLVLYPNYSKTGHIKNGYTGYISEKWIKDWQSPMKHSERAIDVSYRAKYCPANFGSVGNLKGAIADKFINAVSDVSLCIDISTCPQDVIPGKRWHTFLENSRFCLTTSSGSSILDLEGEIQKAVQRYTHLNPNASFREIEQSCFPGKDKKYVFTAISPRNIEAALACTVQIATPGAYSNVMLPVEHYIPLADDCSNIDEVLEMMNDRDLVASIQNRCKEVMLDLSALHFNIHVGKIIEIIKDGVSRKGIRGTSQDKTRRYINRYNARIESYARYYWSVRRNIRLTNRFIYKSINSGIRVFK